MKNKSKTYHNIAKLKRDTKIEISSIVDIVNEMDTDEDEKKSIIEAISEEGKTILNSFSKIQKVLIYMQNKITTTEKDNIINELNLNI